MKIGLQVNNFTWPADRPIGPTFGAIGRRAEEAGFDSLWVMDHFFQIQGIGPPEEPMLEGYSRSVLSSPGQTSKIKLGTMVTGVTYRYPGILVKTVTTLDVLSSGRAYLGIGAAWNEREHVGLGVPFPPLKERFEMLEETLADSPPDVVGRSGALQRQALQPGADTQFPPGDNQAPPAHSDRRRGRAKDAALRCEVR